MTTPRTALGVVAAPNGKIYAIGGGNFSFETNVVEEYTPTTDTWVAKASMPTARYIHAAAAAANGRIYVLGGCCPGPQATNEEYDPSTNTWATRASMPNARYHHAAASAGGKVYAIGGTTSGASPYSCESSVDAYDTVANSWSTRASMATPRCNAGAAATPAGKIFVVGGATASGNPFALDSLEMYDPTTNTWTTKAPMPTARVGLTLAAAGTGKLYAIGGSDQTALNPGGGALTTVEEYDPSTDSWLVQPSLAVARIALGAAVAGNGRLYAVGGHNSAGTVFATNEEASFGVTPPALTDRSQCMNGGFANFIDPRTGQPFRNQGQCVSFVVSQRP